MFNVKNRSKDAAALIIADMGKGENQGLFSIMKLGDVQPLTTRERYDTVSAVLEATGIKVGLSLDESRTVHPHYTWETI